MTLHELSKNGSWDLEKPTDSERPNYVSRKLCRHSSAERKRNEKHTVGKCCSCLWNRFHAPSSGKAMVIWTCENNPYKISKTDFTVCVFECKYAHNVCGMCLG